MQRAIVIAAVLVLVQLVRAQGPPVSIYQCTNSTPLASTNFCNGIVNYPIQTNVVINTVDNTAYALYNSTVATLNNTAANCLSAIKALVCQQGFQKCSSIRVSGGVETSVCSNVQTACAAPTFPTNVTGINTCIANSAMSVSGTFTVCASSTTAANVGAQCRTLSTLVDLNYNGAQTQIGCPSVSACNTTLLCTRPNNLGDACSGTCVTGQAQLGSPLTCINGVCSYANKRGGYNCSSNAECLSNNCVSGKCVDIPVDQACNTTNQCERNTYCEFQAGAGKCTALSPVSTPCGLVSGTSTNPAPCIIGFSCVNTTAGATRGTCVANVDVGGTCTNVTTGSVLANPICGTKTLSTNGTFVCLSNVCTRFLGNQGETCDVTRVCRADLACQYAAGQTTGTCQPAGSVSCTTDGSQGCNTNQVCSCSSASSPGTCSVPTTSGAYQCSSQKTSMLQCLVDNCGGATDAFYPYDGYSCASTKCLSQQNDYYCCVSKYETNFVAPNNAPSVLCAATPTPTPAPSSSTTAAPGTTATPTTTKSSAATLAVSAMTVALVAVAAF